MEMIALILSGLALLAAIVCLGLTARSEKRSEKRNAAVMQYVDSLERTMRGLVLAEAEKRTEQISGLAERIRGLESGVVPDYEQAKAAANAVNDFSRGISNILGFDPMDALKAERAKKEAGDPD